MDGAKAGVWSEESNGETGMRVDNVWQLRQAMESRLVKEKGEEINDRDEVGERILVQLRDLSSEDLQF